MIQQLSNKFQKGTATFLFAICLNGMIIPLNTLASYRNNYVSNYAASASYGSNRAKNFRNNNLPTNGEKPTPKKVERINRIANKVVRTEQKNQPEIGGPSQPEMTSFKSVGTDNMVNLFTGDFSYNIPLLDVGGYPVNIYYDGGVSMEQDASWVGLGWNINPGNVNRNMRGIPDDFNGEEILTQRQTMKPNITWGVTTGVDAEVVGIKWLNIGASVGVSVNNYLGPAFDVGIRGSASVSILSKALGEKNAPTLGGSLSINASSRSGVTFTPGISLGTKAFATGNNTSVGLTTKASTSYNSRSGIKAIQISEQMSFNYTSNKTRKDDVVDQTQNKSRSIGATLASTTISFTKPSYTPSLRMPTTSTATSGHFQLGGSLFGIDGDAEIEGYKQKTTVEPEDEIQLKPMVGYLYYQNAINNANAVMDFNRVNDNEVTPSTPIISAPQYSYDVYSIQGEGTGGSIRAYRNDDGYVRDNFTMTKDKSANFGVDIGIPGQYGGNFSTIKTPSTVGEWGAGNKLRTATGLSFQPKRLNSTFENVYFRNPGENSVLNPNQYDRIGGTSLVRYNLGGFAMSPTIEPKLQLFTKDKKDGGIVNILTKTPIEERKKRTQVISFLTAEEASVIGLDKKIKNYDGNTILDAQKNLLFSNINRFGEDVSHRRNHISQINVLETSGQRYVYGVPVYNITQKDFTFTVNNLESTTDPDKVIFTEPEASVLNEGDKDGYLQTTTTPGYAHSFLLSGLLSPDYVDVTNDGITEDDLGNAVKFNYSKMGTNSKWRAPLSGGTQANFNAGKLTENKDDKGIVSYGERESWYVHSIESKTMIALFKLENRRDAKGSAGELSGIDFLDNSAKCLKQIDLYSKADLKKNGLTGPNAAKPIKTVHFKYSYRLCGNLPSNDGAVETDSETGVNVNLKKGKLTLEKIYFTFNGQNRASKNQYVFGYESPTPVVGENPNYAFNASDRWGSYKPTSQNPVNTSLAYAFPNLKNADYPYSVQNKTTIDQNAGAWMLKQIVLPSGGQMDVTYESDDYAFVQNKRAATMMQVVGFGHLPNAPYNNELYTLFGLGVFENTYAFIKVPEACANPTEVFQKYLSGVDQLSFKMAVQMPKGLEFMHSYATIENNGYGVYTADATNKTIWVKLSTNKDDDYISPLSLTAIEFLREQLPGQAYPGYDVSDDDGLEQIASMLIGFFDGISSAFTGPVKHLRNKSMARFVDLSKTFVRLNDPDGVKYGGGYRVKSVRLKDNWKTMNGGQLYTSIYGQDYDYSTKEIFNGQERNISSGVASYEPSLGGDENPFQTMIQVSNTVPLGPTSYGAVEMPVLDAFFPAASVGYSKVTVRSVKRGVQDPNKKSRSGIGKQVTEYYTAKDYPTQYSNTDLDPASDIQAHVSSFTAFFYKYSFDSRSLSQGFLIENNDMHGKMKSQSSFPENDEKTAVNYTQNFYKNTGEKGMAEKFDFVYAGGSGNVTAGSIVEGNMGIDVELMTDTREFAVRSKSFEMQAQVDLFPVIGVLPWLPFAWAVSGGSENIYKAVTTTKVVTYHSVLDSVLVIDKGSQVGTKNMIYDAETGEVIVNRTNNEFKQPIYNTNYPAWWAYSGMGLAYKNIDATYTGRYFRNGKIVSGGEPTAVLESGDEVYVTQQQDIPPPAPLTGTLSFACSAGVGNPGNGILTFNLSAPTTSITRLILGARYYSSNSGYSGFGCSEFVFPAGTACTQPLPIYIDIPSGVTTYSTPISYCGATRSVVACACSAPLDIYVKVQSPNYFPNLTLTTSGIVMHNINPDNLQCEPCIKTSCDATRLWVFDKNKSNSSLTNTAPDYYFMDEEGRLFNKDNVTFRIVRSGHRNMLNATAGSVMSTMVSPVVNNKILLNNTSNVVNASAVVFKEKWQNDADILKRYRTENPPNPNLVVNGDFSAGNTGFGSNYCWRSFNDYFGSYFVGITWPSASGGNFNVQDHTTGNGNLMFVDGPSTDGDHCASLAPNLPNSEIPKIWNQSFAVTPNTYYKISYWALNRSSQNLPILRFLLNGNQLASDLYLNSNIYQWINYCSFWYSGYNTSANIAILDLNGNSQGNDFAIDDISFKLDNCGVGAYDVVDCAGFLKQAINPYVRGLLGTFRPEQEKVFYGARKESVPNPLTNLVVNGFLDNFKLYWDFNINNNLVPDDLNSQWVYKSSITKINSKGLELETKDALNIYTAAQYGYNKTMPVAITNNSKYREMFNESFEDKDYNETLNGAILYSCMNKHIDFSSIANTVIANDYGINAHTGKNVMQVIANTTASKSVVLQANDYYNFDMPLLSSTTNDCTIIKPIPATESMINPIFSPATGTIMLFSAWVKQSCGSPTIQCIPQSYTASTVRVINGSNNAIVATFSPTGSIIEGWQKIEGSFTVPSGCINMKINFINTDGNPIYFDDIRMHPYNANMKSYVYDPINLRLVAELDANNYAMYYEYDEEGTLVRTKAETKEGIKTLKETRSAKQKLINAVIP